MVLDSGRELELRARVDRPRGTASIARARSPARACPRARAPLARRARAWCDGSSCSHGRSSTGHRLVAAQEHGIAAAVAVLARVELDEVGAGVELADEDRDREHRLGHGQDAFGPARALAARMNPARSAPASAATATSSSRVSPQTLTSGRASSSRSFPAGSAARMSADPTRRRRHRRARRRPPGPATRSRSRPPRQPFRLSNRLLQSRLGHEVELRARSMWKVVRSRALIPIGSAPRATARSSSPASCASTRASSPRSRRRP